MEGKSDFIWVGILIPSLRKNTDGCGTSLTDNRVWGYYNVPCSSEVRPLPLPVAFET